MANLLTLHRVQDYDAWRPHFDEHEKMRQEYGITSPRVYRDVTDPNDLALLFEVADVNRAKEFGESTDLRAVMERAGVMMPPKIIIIP